MSNNFENRPLSPHLSIHKKVLTAVFSIFHRITGIGLSIGAILISIWFILISLGPSYFAYFQMISSGIFFKLILILWSFGIFYHLFNGIRKLYWSFGIGMDLRSVYGSGYVVLFLTFLSTIMVWLFV